MYFNVGCKRDEGKWSIFLTFSFQVDELLDDMLAVETKLAY